MRTLLSLLACALLATAGSAQAPYASLSLSAGNGESLSASYGSAELGLGFGNTMVGGAFGRDLAADDHAGVYFVELRATQLLPLYDDGPAAYVCGGIGQYLDGRWVNEFGAGLCWDSGLSVGACSFGGYGYLSIGYTLQ